jgi:hypothetical protein
MDEEKFWQKIVRITLEAVHKFNKLAFSLLLVYLLGILTGSFISWQIYKWEANRMVKLGGVIINERVYDVKVRP